MQKYLPYLFPALALIIVLFLTYRWYNLKTSNSDGSIPEFAQGVEIKELTDNDILARSASRDYKSIELQSTAPEALGTLRYEVKDGQLNLSVISTLPEAKEGGYQVWFQSADGKSRKKAFKLDMKKGGYTGSVSVSADILPFEVIVSRETTDDNQLESIVLKGIVPSEEKE